MENNSNKKAVHTIIRNGHPFCTHCGGEHKLIMPMPLSIYTQHLFNFTKLHSKCKKTWKQPMPDLHLSIEERMQFWLEHGERGISSETIFETISGFQISPCGFKNGYPADPSDFHRCYMLLQMIPEWKSKLHLLRPLSSKWRALVDSWETLTLLLQEQLNTGKDNGMYKIMQNIIDQHE